MVLPDRLIGVLLVVALAVLLLLLITTVVLAVRLRRLRGAYAASVDADRGESLFEALQRHLREVAQLRDDLRVVHGNTQHLRDLLRATVSRVGVVRYDAFEDMGGALSFSAALLDEGGDGIVLSAINGRTETRTYAKPIAAGRSQYNLSPEETAAIEAALTSDTDVTVAAPTRRGRMAS